MLEILLQNTYALPVATRIECFSQFDVDIANLVIARTRETFTVEQLEPEIEYAENAAFRLEVETFSNSALDDPAWKGNGLDFDRLR